MTPEEAAEFRRNMRSMVSGETNGDFSITDEFMQRVPLTQSDTRSGDLFADLVQDIALALVRLETRP